MTRKIAVVTGTRAEYGLLVPVLDAIEAHAGLSLQLVVTGTHLTTRSIDDIGHGIAAKVTMQKKGRPASRDADVRALGRGVSGLGEAFAALGPDVVVVLGDRIEALAGGLAGQVGGRWVGHIHGGDRAEGVSDEAMRHAISKVSHLHFAATAQSRRRLIRMGEDQRLVWNTGSPAIDLLSGIEPADDGPKLIVMHHPVGDLVEVERRHMDALLTATARHDRLVMSPNFDPGREGVMQAIKDHDVEPVDHLPRERFVSLLKSAKLIVGNSSAGLIEASAVRTPAVNVGSRQAGRERPSTVIDAACSVPAIRSAIKRALSLDTRRLRHPYGDGRAGQRIAEHLASVDLGRLPRHKRNAY